MFLLAYIHKLSKLMYNNFVMFMKCEYEYIVEIKKSKFIAQAYHVTSDDEVKVILESLWKSHKKARHIPYAYKLQNTARKTDDKEPQNTAGLPILNILERENLVDTLIVVIRYFGGTKLGVGPLMRAYSSAANGVAKMIKSAK